jgi:hypothetical protein
MASRSRKQKPAGRHVALSVIPLIGDAPPAEFRIFVAGENQTSKGVYLFDDIAAAAVMKAYAAHGCDVMIDLEHLSIADQDRSLNFDPDARGWCKLELRNGELWAAQVTWTPDGLIRLSEKRQRYMSPAFVVNDDDRIIEVLNIAITAMPATHNLEPLVAASQRRIQRLAFEAEGDQKMSPEQFAAIAEALGLGADANIEDVLATIAAMVKKVQDAANGTETPAEAAADPAVAAAAEAVPVVAAASRLMAAARALVRLSGKKDVGAAVAEAEAWRASHIELEQGRAKLAQERALLENGERRRLVAELVKCGSESPGTAWADDSATKPAEPWASMPMDALRSRVVKLTKTKATPAAAGAKPAPVAADAGGQVVMVRGEAVELSAREVQTCAEMKAKLEDYAANKLIRARAIAQQG